MSALADERGASSLCPSAASFAVEPVFFLEIGFVVKNLRGVIVAISNGAKVILGNVGGQHYTAFARGKYLEEVARSDSFVMSTKPCLNVSIAFVNPISGKNSIATMDKYPLFDEQGNVSGVASYAYECFDDVTISNCSDYLRPQVVGSEIILEALHRVNQDALNEENKLVFATARSNALLYTKALSQINTKLRKPLRTVEEPGRFYAGRLFLRVTSLFAEVGERDPDAPTISLEIDHKANLYCMGERDTFELLLWHAFEMAFCTSPPKLHIGVINTRGPRPMLRIKFMWYCAEGLPPVARLHYTAVECTSVSSRIVRLLLTRDLDLSQSGGFKCQVESSDVNILMLFIPLSSTPLPLHPTLVRMLDEYAAEMPPSPPSPTTSEENSVSVPQTQPLSETYSSSSTVHDLHDHHSRESGPGTHKRKRE